IFATLSRQKCRSYTEYLQRYRDKNVAPTQNICNAIATKMSLLRRISEIVKNPTRTVGAVFLPRCQPTAGQSSQRSINGTTGPNRDKNVAPTQNICNAIATKMSLLHRISATLSRQKCRSYEASGQINAANTGWLCAGCAAGRLFRFVPVAACPAVAVLLSAGFPETAVVRWSSGSVL